MFPHYPKQGVNKSALRAWLRPIDKPHRIQLPPRRDQSPIWADRQGSSSPILARQSPRTTKLYDRQSDEVIEDESEKISI